MKMLSNIKNNLVGLCTDSLEQDPRGEDIKERIRKIRRAVIESPSDWTQKTENIRIKIVTHLNNALWRKDVGFQIACADGLMDEAIKIIKEEWNKGVPKGLDKAPVNVADLDILEDAIDLEGWLLAHGEGILGPSWWMDNQQKEEGSWNAVEVMWLNKALLKRDGSLVGESGKYVFRFLGKGNLDRGEWVLSQQGHEHLFAVYLLDNDPRIDKIDTGLDINLERWLEAYEEMELPARFMCLVEGRSQQMALTKQLKSLDGELVGSTHVWRFVGNKTYKLEGKVNLFSCERRDL